MAEPERVNRPGDQPRYRVGRRCPWNVYRVNPANEDRDHDDRFAVAIGPEAPVDGPLIAAALNAFVDGGRPRGEADSEDARRGLGVPWGYSESAPPSTGDPLDCALVEKWLHGCGVAYGVGGEEWAAFVAAVAHDVAGMLSKRDSKAAEYCRLYQSEVDRVAELTRERGQLIDRALPADWRLRAAMTYGEEFARTLQDLLHRYGSKAGRPVAQEAPGHSVCSDAQCGATWMPDTCPDCGAVAQGVAQEAGEPSAWQREMAERAAKKHQVDFTDGVLGWDCVRCGLDTRFNRGDCAGRAAESDETAKQPANDPANQPGVARVWQKGDPEPVERRLIVRDFQGDEWGRVREGWMLIKIDGDVPNERGQNLGPHSWSILRGFAPLTEVLEGGDSNVD